MIDRDAMKGNAGVMGKAIPNALLSLRLKATKQEKNNDRKNTIHQKETNFTCFGEISSL